MKRRLLLGGLGAVAVAFLGIQAIPVERTNPPVELDIPAPPQVKAILRASCYDCHSNETVWPWYSRVAPVSWLLSRDTMNGRDHMNFSTWNQFIPEQQTELIATAMKKLKAGQMPPRTYTLIHSEGRITPEKLAVLEAWAAKYPN